MSLRENRTLFRRHIEEVVNQGHRERIPECVAAPFVETCSQLELALPRAFPDRRHATEQMVAEGDLVMMRETITAAHQGEFIGYAPTGRKLTASEMTVHRFADGKIVGHRVESNAGSATAGRRADESRVMNDR